MRSANQKQPGSEVRVVDQRRNSRGGREVAGSTNPCHFATAFLFCTEEPVINEDDGTRSFTLIVEPYGESRPASSKSQGTSPKRRSLMASACHARADEDIARHKEK